MYISDVLHVIYVGGRIILGVGVKYLCRLCARKGSGKDVLITCQPWISIVRPIIAVFANCGSWIP
jgi:hypothetical protein